MSKPRKSLLDLNYSLKTLTLIALALTKQTIAQSFYGGLKYVQLVDTGVTSGWQGVSFAGGAEINIVGPPFSPAESMKVILQAASPFQGSWAGPAPDQDNAFMSDVMNGVLEYTTPDLPSLLGFSIDDFLEIENVNIQVGVIDPAVAVTADQEQGSVIINGGQSCFLQFSRSYTPILYYLSPRVMYQGSEVDYYVDPKSTQNYRLTDSSGNYIEWPFLEARVNQYTIDFNDFIDDSSSLNGYSVNQVRGYAQSIRPSVDAPVTFKTRSGYAMHDPMSTVCSIDNTTCYEAKVVPSISSISASSGYTTGNQLVTINGFGFNSTTQSVLIDGVACVVQTASDTQITCRTGAQASPSSAAYYIGGQGIRRSFFNTTQLTGASLTTAAPAWEILATSFETPQNVQGTTSGNIFRGYFKAPTTANYRFYMSCDDNCKLFLSPSADPSQKQQLLSLGYSSYRGYWTVDGSRTSAWQALTAGQYYYIEGQHNQQGGADSFTVSVELDGNTIVGHQQSMKEIQRLQINSVSVREVSQIVILAPDGGTMTVTFTNPADASFWTSTAFSTTATASQVSNAISGYFSKVYGATITVVRAMFDSTGANTTSVAAAAKIVYNITVNKALTGPSYTFPKATKVTAGSGVTASVIAPSNVQLSSAPLSGSFYVTCIDNTGLLAQTTDIPTSYAPWQILNAILTSCPQYKDKITIWDGPAYSSYNDGRDILIRFGSFNADPPQFNLGNSQTTPLAGPINITFNDTTLIPYGTNLVYEPVPFDWLYTNETSAQVLVTVDNQPAVCSSLTCGYGYVAPTGQITGFTFSGNTLTITGTSLTTTGITVSYADQSCSVTSATSTQIVCTVPSTTAGSWTPILIDQSGQIPLASGVAAQSIALTVSSITPNTNLNNQGGNTLTIVGSNFPGSLAEVSAVTVTLSDGSICAITSLSSTQIKCVTDYYSGSVGSATPLTVAVYGVSDSSHTVTFATAPAQVLSISPSTVSPVLTTFITLQVNPSYTGGLTASDLSATIVSTTDATNFINLYVVSTDSNANTVTIKYNGASSGTYKLRLTSASNGRFDTTAVTLTAIGIVTGFSPTQGSKYGGTLITITGYNFSNSAITDNPVQIGTTPCDVQTTSNTQITCITEAQNPGDSNTEDLIVFLRTFEEAVCGLGVGQCQYTWVQDGSLPVLSSYSAAFDTTLNDYVLTLTGSFFVSSPSQVTFIIDGIQQTVLTASQSSITVQIVGMLGSSSTNIQFYLPSGTPQGASQLTTTGITLTPVILSISPLTGSPAGSTITAVVKGVGPQSSIKLLMQSNGNLCQSLSVPTYGKVICNTVAISQAANTIQAQQGSNKYQCSNSALCTYQTSNSMPTVASQSLTTTQIIFTGTNFFIGGDWISTVSYGGVSADTVSIDSSSQVTATWNLGTPLTNQSVIPVLQFVSPTLGSHYAINTNALSNLITVVISDTQNYYCSFVGGCLFSYTQAGLASTMTNPNNYITLCGQKASLDPSSTANSAVFQMPVLATEYSIKNYNISQQSFLVGSPFSSNSNYSITMAVFDGNNINGFSSTTATCSFGTGFKSGFVGEVYQVKFWMNQFTPSIYVNKLQFQASISNITWTTIFTVGYEIHEGWNYYDFSSNPLQYRFYRFYSNAGSGGCNIGEIGLLGVEVLNTNTNFQECQADIYINNTLYPMAGTYYYNASLTPFLQSISPRFGQVEGGDLVTFTGTNFVADTTKYTITIDGVNCPVQSATTTTVTCLTGPRPGLVNTSLSIYVKGYGYMALNNLVFRYVNYWSNPLTWGNDFLPMDGDSIVIPAGLNLLVDIQNSPIINAIDVEGSLIFPPNSDPNYQVTFDAHYIMVKGGYLEIGTEEFPYTSKLTITMHGSRFDPTLPTFGNKVIACYQCTLDIHGNARVVWTELLTTAQPGDTQITLNTAVDWQVGEEIVIATTSYDNTQNERMTIASVDNTNPNNPVVTLTAPLQFKHFAGIDTYSSTDFIEMRAEVGLITRNIVYQGDPETSIPNMYGAHIMMSSPGDDSLTGRIAYVELRYVGQAFQLGRYPIHWHMIGQVTNSYAIGNCIHDTYNRALTAHHVSYLRVIQNFAYMTMGHTFFIEDAVETNNLYQQNLAIEVHASWSLLNTDQSPAAFWITHPDNYFVGNHAVASDRYGYWYDTKPHPTGPSADPTQCPENCQIGSFINNTAHSNLKYGLRIFHKLIPRTYPCMDLMYDPTNTTDPYWQNPLITANFYNFTGWKHQENGAIFEQLGDVRFINFKAADNMIAGIEVSLSSDTVDGTCQIENALVVGVSSNAETFTANYDLRGIITPRTENFQVNGARFYNFPNNNHAALGDCSHCFSDPSTDSGARTVTTSKLYFDSSVLRRIIYQYPYRGIWYDTDGTLTGQGAGSFAVAYWQHLVQPECIVNDLVYNGLVCKPTVQVRRLAFWNQTPWTIFAGMQMSIIPFDSSIVGSFNETEMEDYLSNTTAWSIVPFKQKQDPMGWAIPFVTNHKYRLHWGYDPVDWVTMEVDQSIRWKTTDSYVYLYMNFTDVRAQINVTANGLLQVNNTLNVIPKGQWVTGDNVVYNDSSISEMRIETVFNGVNSIVQAFNGSQGGTGQQVTFSGSRCIGPCLTQINNTPIENTTRRWSDPTSWTSGQVPVAGDNVTIESSWNMLYDVALSPILGYLEINGRLTFEDGVKDLTLQSKYIFVRAGQLIIGNQTNPYQMNAKIVLYGEPSSSEIVFFNAIEAGNKILTNTNLIQMFGKQRQQFTRLMNEVQPGDNYIVVEAGLDWQAGDNLGIAPTGMSYLDYDYATVTSYDPSTGIASLDRQLSAYHYGAPDSTASIYGVDIRGEVQLLSRNIKIVGDTSQNAWGCTILTSDFPDYGVWRMGNTIMDSVEVYNCSQFDTLKSAIRFEGANLAWSSITNSSFYQGWGMGATILQSSNILFQNNNFFNFVRFGLIAQNDVYNLTVDSNVMVGVSKRTLIIIDMFVDTTGGFIMCADTPGQKCRYSVTNNIAAGTYFSGFVVQGHNCGNYSQTVFRNNVAHSSENNGAVIFPSVLEPSQTTCMEGSYFTAYKCQLDGAVSAFTSLTQQYSNMLFLDNGQSGTLVGGIEGDNLWAKMNNITIWGELPSRDCLTQNACQQNSSGPGCIDRQAFWLPFMQTDPKPPMPDSADELPMHSPMGAASWGGNILLTNLHFKNFTSTTTWCGNAQSIININPASSDYQPRAKFVNTIFENVHQNAFAYLFSPPWAWANFADCGNWPCSAPNNTFLEFINTIVNGTIKPQIQASTFQVVPHNTQAVSYYSTCQNEFAWNAYLCQEDGLGIILFESLDVDSDLRMLAPISIVDQKTGSNSTVNQFMDHTWDGFYTGQIRMARFPAIVNAYQGSTYTITYTGTPPNAQRFQLITDSYYGSVFTIPYPVAGVYAVLDTNQNLIAQNAWNDTLQAINPIQRKSCGENVYTGVANTLQFYLTPGCMIYIQPVNAIASSVRMQWTLAQFYADGGSTTFSDRMASSLGIQPQDIKVVAVYTGSVVVQYSIQDNSGSIAQNYGDISSLQSELVSQISSGKLNLGAPILSASVSSQPVTIQSSGTGSTTNGTSNPSNPSNNGTNGTGTNGTGNNNSTGQKIITINSNGTTIVTETSSSNDGSNSFTLIIILAVLAGVIILSGVAGFLIYKRCQRGSAKTQVMVPQTDHHTSNISHIRNVPDDLGEIQYHPKAEFGTIFNSPDQAYKINNVDNVENNNISHMSNAKMLHIPQTDYENAVYTNHANAHEGDSLRDINLKSNRTVQIKRTVDRQ